MNKDEETPEREKTLIIARKHQICNIVQRTNSLKALELIFTFVKIIWAKY